MDLTDYDPKMSFKLGFLARCAEEGLAGASLDMRVKQATWASAAGEFLSSMPGLAASTAKGTAVGAIGIPAALGLAVGGLGGYTAAQLATPPINVDELKAEELAATYSAYANRIRSRKKALQYKPVR